MMQFIASSEGDGTFICTQLYCELFLSFVNEGWNVA